MQLSAEKRTISGQNITLFVLRISPIATFLIYSLIVELFLIWVFGSREIFHFLEHKCPINNYFAPRVVLLISLQVEINWRQRREFRWRWNSNDSGVRCKLFSFFLSHCIENASKQTDDKPFSDSIDSRRDGLFNGRWHHQRRH